MWNHFNQDRNWEKAVILGNNWVCDSAPIGFWHVYLYISKAHLPQVGHIISHRSSTHPPCGHHTSLPVNDIQHQQTNITMHTLVTSLNQQWQLQFMTQHVFNPTPPPWICKQKRLKKKLLDTWKFALVSYFRFSTSVCEIIRLYIKNKKLYFQIVPF